MGSKIGFEKEGIKRGFVPSTFYRPRLLKVFENRETNLKPLLGLFHIPKKRKRNLENLTSLFNLKIQNGSSKILDSTDKTSFLQGRIKHPAFTFQKKINLYQSNY